MELKLGSLFDGIGGWMIAAVKNGIKPVWASEIEKSPCAVTAHWFPDVRQLGDINGIDGSKIEPVDIVCAGSPCFTAGTLVMTNNGPKEIQDVVAGDFVFTHKGRYMPVMKTGRKRASNIGLMKCTGSPITYVTKNHPYYVRHMKYVWDSDKKSSKRIFSNPEWVKVCDLKNDDFVSFPIDNRNENRYELTEEECWLIGRYIADGFIRNSKRKDRENQFNNAVVFCIGKDKKEQFLKKHFRISY